ncbi:MULTISPECIES: DUF3231 family protein [Brevibacillus]|uniref:DUF3231 family protein n=1 Tax=Brevibacillus TaxID=55080 RepID=UPI0002716E4E|nr:MULTISPECIES: DUF3231 family protein [Brevibacillus]EJL42831.1 Protein of unknown function (DUF3231) [Brevibacillus sp. CF112]MBG9564651.1 membrane protein [Brevibacillus agri]MDN4093229.1 DUF3231 family protein [Brevibacillus agri]MED1825700.1 DUF3231 family protein [Brevibacillus agri]MED4570769.1 DUF3231 family protein [Brevibacillus agri]
MGIFGGNPKNEPMHYGEVFGVWVYLATTKALLAGYQTAMNHAGDTDLKDFLEDLMQTMKKEIERLEDLLKLAGVGLPPTPPDRPVADANSIPVGARLNDSEIALGISRDIAGGLLTCSQIMSQSIREDIGMMFGEFHMTKAQSGYRLLRILKEKGWLISPPLHAQAPELAHV